MRLLIVLGAALLIAACAGKSSDRSTATAADRSGEWAALTYTSRSDDRIVGGTAARPGDWPYFADLYRYIDGNEEHFCGGVVIARRWVLTAAHCFDTEITRPPGGGSYIWRQSRAMGLPLASIGSTDLNTSNTAGTFQFAEVLIHPQYSKIAYATPPDTTQGPSHDLALVRLNSAWPGPYARLSAGGEADNDGQSGRAFVAGFGLKADTTLGGAVLRIADLRNGKGRYAGSASLLHAMLPMKAPALCEEKYRAYGYTGAIQICAGRREGKVDSCQGDSGGPLMALDAQSRAYVVGVVSFGFICGEQNSEGVYTRVSAQRSWIEALVPDAIFVEARPEAALIAASETFEAMARVLAPTGQRMTLAVSPAEPAPGEAISLQISSTVSGRLIVFESSGDGVSLYFPNAQSLTRTEMIEAGKTVRIPDHAGYRLTASKDGGRLYAIVLPPDIAFVGDLMPTQDRIANGEEQPEDAPLDYATRLLSEIRDRSGAGGLASWASQSVSYRTRTPPPP